MASNNAPRVPQEILDELSRAGEAGDRIAILKAVRKKLVADLVVCSTRDSGPIAKAIMEIDDLLARLDTNDELTNSDLGEFMRMMSAKHELS